MTIIESLRNYISDLNALKLYNNIVNVNYLDDEEDSFSIEELATEPIVKKYVDGRVMKQLDFTFCSREPYGVEVMQNLDNSSFYEDFANEIENNNNNDVLPVLDSKYEAISLTVTSSSYLAYAEDDKAMYSINLKFKYIM